MTRTFLITTAQDARDAASLGLPCGFLFYRISQHGTLQRASLPFSARGGLMGIFEAPGLPHADPAVLVRAILAECSRRSYGGVILDLQPQRNGPGTLAALAIGLQRRGLPVFLPQSIAHMAPGCQVILPGLLSGGTFDQMLDHYIARFGAEHVCLDLQRGCHSFTMPSYDPNGRKLTRQEFQEILQTYQPSIFFSPELCTRYFTYRPQGQGMQFVLFDDPDTEAQKLRRAAKKGIHSCFLLYSEWGSSARSIVPSALSRKS